MRRVFICLALGLMLLPALAASTFADKGLDARLARAAYDCNNNKVLDLISQGANPDAEVCGANGSKVCEKISDWANWGELITNLRMAADARDKAVYQEDLEAARKCETVIDMVKAAAALDPSAQEKPSRSDRLILAAAAGDEALVKTLLAKGADVNATNDLGYTALIAAVKGGYSGIVHLLIKKGANVNAEKDGETTLMYSIRGNHAGAARQLLDAGADSQLLDDDILAAAAIGNAEIVDFLIEKGADVNTKDDSWTVLSSAAYHGHAGVVRLLLAKGADVNDSNSNGNTALMQAASAGHPRIVKLLLDKGADERAVNNKGWTALDEVEYSRQLDGQYGLPPAKYDETMRLLMEARHSKKRPAQ